MYIYIYIYMVCVVCTCHMYIYIYIYIHNIFEIAACISKHDKYVCVNVCMYVCMFSDSHDKGTFPHTLQSNRPFQFENTENDRLDGSFHIRNMCV
jgi:hypothetical protein